MGLTWLFLQRLSLGLIGQMVTLCTALILRFEISHVHCEHGIWAECKGNNVG